MSSSTPNPRTTKREFFGAPGALTITSVVPVVLYALYFGCSEKTGGCPPPYVYSLEAVKEAVVSSVTHVGWWKGLWDNEAAILYLGWHAFCVVSWAILPGDWIEGTKLRNGKRIQYKINALPTFLLTLGIVGGLIYRDGPKVFTFINEKFVGLLTAALAMSFAQATLFYLASFRHDNVLLALAGNSGNPIYDWFIGRELNPHIGSFDVMTFNELRPGLILWVLIDISMVCEQAVRRGGFQNVTDSMWLVLAFQTWYVMDSLYNEPALNTTMDVTTDGFGFMLHASSHSTMSNSAELGPLVTAGVITTNLIGYYIFRSSNGDKNDFRNGKNPKNLKSMDTKRGTKLLISGWWGLCQHPNYMGDLITAFAWCLPTGFATPITYFYPIYFLALLVHRQMRDDEACGEKYGEDWERYKKLVPYSFSHRLPSNTFSVRRPTVSTVDMSGGGDRVFLHGGNWEALSMWGLSGALLGASADFSGPASACLLTTEGFWTRVTLDTIY